MGLPDRHVGTDLAAHSDTPLLEALEQRMMLTGSPDLLGTVTVSDVTLSGTPNGAGSVVRLGYERNADPGPGLESYTIKLIATEPGYIASAFEGRFEGTMNQVWRGGVVPTPTLTSANYLSPAEKAMDTHLLFTDDPLQFMYIGVPTEDYDPATGLGEWFGGGDNWFAVAIRNATASQVDLAQLVIPAGEEVTITGKLGFKWDLGGIYQYGDTPGALTIPSSQSLFDVDYTLRNVGDAAAGAFSVDFYLSADSALDAGDTHLRRIGVPGMDAGAVQAAALVDLPLPAGQLDNDWYVLMDIDADGDVIESSTLNNQAHDQVTAQTPSMTIADAQIVEGDEGTTDLVFDVNLSAATNATVSASWQTIDGSAEANTDFVPLGGAVVLAPGQTSATVTVPIMGDTDIETDESFQVQMSNPVGATLADDTATGTILNDDTPAVTIDDVIITEGDSGTRQAVFTVRLSDAYHQQVEVDYATVDGTASAGGDYTARTGTLTFTPGQTAKTVAVTVSGDTSLEVDETFFLDLSAPAGATLGDARGIGTIENDDGVIRGFDAGRRVRFTDSNGDLVTISMRGPGEGRVVFEGVDGFDPHSISLTGTTAKSKVTVTTKGAGSSTTIRRIAIDGYLGGFTGKTLDLRGDFTSGPVTKLVLRNVTGDYVIDIGARAASDAKSTCTIVLGRVADVSLVSLTPIKGLTVIDWRGDPGAERITAPQIAKLTAKGAKKASVAGDFDASLDLTGGPGVDRALLGTTKIAGALRGVSWDVAGEMGKLTVVGAVTGSTLRADGSMAGVKVGASVGSDFLAGIDDNAFRRPDGPGEFDNILATIKSFKVKGIKTAGAPRWLFSDSNVSAATIGTVALLNVDFANNDTPFGIWARDAGTGKEIKSVKWADKIEKTVKGIWTTKAGLVFALPDLAIEILST